MGCCGQGRAALRSATGAGRAPATVVRYVGGKRVRVRGSVSGRMYEFTGGVRTAVESGDAAALVRTGLFVRS
jgi:hypothetical protein